MPLSKPASLHSRSGNRPVAACLGASATAAENNDHKPAVVTHRTHHAYRHHITAPGLAIAD